MVRKYRGEIVYNSEVDKHFPHLTVRQTLEFAASMRAPRNSVLAPSRKGHVKKVTAVAMAICGLSQAQNTKVGNDFVRGVSGGERKVKHKTPSDDLYSNKLRACQYCGDDISSFIDWLLGQ